jgi:hypothetical protein
MRIRLGQFSLLFLSIAILGQAACSSSRPSSGRAVGGRDNVGYTFYPPQAQADVYGQGQSQQKALSVMASVMDVRDAAGSASAAIEVRMRFENMGSENVRFDPASLSLANGMLQSFPRPATTAGAIIQIAPNTTHDVNVLFNFPPGQNAANFSIDNLRLRWDVEIKGQAVPQAVVFQRVDDTAS